MGSSNRLRIALAVGLLAWMMPACADAFDGKYRSVGTAAIRIYYDQPVVGTATSVLAAFPAIRADLKQTLGWELKQPVTIVLVSDQDRYLRLASSPVFLAFAVPERRLVVMDQSRLSPDGTRLDGTLRHELCHLLLHEYIDTRRLPRWLDEGVCQWASDGFSELIDPERHMRAEQILQSGRIVPFAGLARRFPRGRQELELAYAQSRLFVDFLVLQGGRDRLLELLQAVAAGNVLDASMEAVYGRSLDQLVVAWRDRMGAGGRRFLLLFAAHLYEIIFFVGALAAVIGYFRKRRRHHRYPSDEEEDFDS